MTRGAGDVAGEIARAKINLALHLGARRADGYRLIDSLVVFAEYGDRLTAMPAGRGSRRLALRGPLAAALADTPAAENLVVRAVDAACEAAGRQSDGIELVLTKRLPVAAGLGGGSADAAATLRLVDRRRRLHLGGDRLAEIGIKLGADVPMCLASRPLLATGIGDRITPVTGMPRLAVVLACPPVKVATRAAFAAAGEGARHGLPPLPSAPVSLAGLLAWLKETRNDLAPAAATVAKGAGAAAAALGRDPESLFARMTGSGAAAFAIFPSLAAARRAAARLRAARPTWWAVATTTGGS